MTWDDFAPYVLPYATGCPDATMEHHVRLAAIDFCRHTFVWKADLAPLVANSVLTSFPMASPTDAEVCKLLGVSTKSGVFAAVDAEVVTPLDGAQRIRDERMGLIAYTSDLRSLVVWPAQANAVAITAQVALKPSITAATFPDDLFAHHAQDIANGALASILSMPKKEWTDMPTAAIKAAEFSSRKNSLALIVERGNAKSTRRTTTRWY